MSWRNDQFPGVDRFDEPPVRRLPRESVEPEDGEASELFGPRASLTERIRWAMDMHAMYAAKEKP